mmetsp:Transcript_142085/g.354084  ORF Transcript_142085/g.354084 Transcript_142085/m.354084 type:complete len:206 (-) Transcript_142085:225-842(-)
MLGLEPRQWPGPGSPPAFAPPRPRQPSDSAPPPCARESRFEVLQQHWKADSPCVARPPPPRHSGAAPLPLQGCAGAVPWIPQGADVPCSRRPRPQSASSHALVVAHPKTCACRAPHPTASEPRPSACEAPPQDPAAPADPLVVPVPSGNNKSARKGKAPIRLRSRGLAAIQASCRPRPPTRQPKTWLRLRLQSWSRGAEPGPGRG